MSISRHIDEYVAERGIKQSDEVVPENACQVFDGEVADSAEELEAARQRIADLMG